MNNDPLKHQRRTIRLAGYDYTRAGAYFVTLVTKHRLCVLGESINGAMQLTDWGRGVAAGWRAIPRHFAFAALDEWVVMPNHLHAILVLTGVRAAAAQVKSSPSSAQPNQLVPAAPPGPRGTQPGSLGAIIQNFKAVTTRRLNQHPAAAGVGRFAWQRNYYEHIIRDDEDLERVRRYIADNVARWARDDENPDRSPA